AYLLHGPKSPYIPRYWDISTHIFYTWHTGPIAQPDQAAIVADNADMFLMDGGYLLLAIKARSIDVTKEPSEIYRREVNTLKERGFEIIDVVHLEPYDKDHAMIYAIYHRKR
ncbi:MAG: fibrillarin-like rRNA/tRNA 2'-O-methyltransferase, partial [Desulfurococcaceae archaeon]